MATSDLFILYIHSVYNAYSFCIVCRYFHGYMVQGFNGVILVSCFPVVLLFFSLCSILSNPRIVYIICLLICLFILHNNPRIILM
jgi:hypothetical protein